MNRIVLRLALAVSLVAITIWADDGPGPLVIGASEYFDGIDGPWSSFYIRVGTPAKDLRVMVSTASPESMVVLSNYGCTTSVFSTVPSDCENARGDLFTTNQSSTWKGVGTYGINNDGVGLEANLGYSETAEWGHDELAIGLTGPGFSNQTIAGIVRPEPFYLGLFGLNNQPVNFSEVGNTSTPSFVTTLKSEGKIPSLSWSYTAGAKYRLKQVYGQLIFSGYDTSRFQANDITFDMAGDITRDLVVSLRSISHNGSINPTLLSDPVYTFIDSTDPNIWLPDDACDAFEQAFGLTLDSDSGLYLVNETQHNALLAANPTISFNISNTNSGGDVVTINFPYAAFDLTAEYPLVSTNSSYFPIKRAANSTQYTLGRTFLQEAYLSADYERNVFNVSANVWNENAQSNVVTIPPKGSGDSGSGGSGGGSSHSSKLSGGTIAGIVVGSLLGSVLVVLIISVIVLRKRRKWMGQAFAIAAVEPEPDEAVLKGPVLNSGTLNSGSGTRSTTDRSTPMTADDISAGLGASGTSPESGETKNVSTATNSSSAVELDARDTHITPKTELDGREVQNLTPNRSRLQVVSEMSEPYELPGSEVPNTPDTPWEPTPLTPTYRSRDEQWQNGDFEDIAEEDEPRMK